MPESQHPDFYRSILCGESASNSDFNTAFSDLGLIHLILITTCHLEIFDRFQDLCGRIWIRYSSRRYPLHDGDFLRVAVRIGIFGVFVLLGGGKAYLVRSWLSLCLREINAFFHLGWRPVQRAAFAGFVCLLFCANENEARALTIGWVASLAFALSYGFWQFAIRENGELFRYRSREWLHVVWSFLSRHLSASILLYLFLLPLFISSGWPSVWIVLANALLAPVLSHVLFPLALLFRSFFVLRNLIDTCVDGILYLLTTLAIQIPEPLRSTLAKGVLESGISRVSYAVLISIFALLMEELFLHPKAFGSPSFLTTAPDVTNRPQTHREVGAIDV